MSDTPETLMDLGLDGIDSLFDKPEEMDLSVPISSEPRQRDLRFFRQIPVRVTLEVASTELPLGELMQAGKGSVLELDKPAGAPLDVRVNGHLLARGEVVLINGKYGLRLTEVVDEQLLDGLDA
ncbi:flagellar motor switch protein FliN [Pseudaeromonas sp. ZJS20]|uniref:flagellar motor switch protein FliN n=1 Tax=Pseudaeromonas aegiceratis TaxID=3153928 RepID=UPI00390C5D56